MAQFDRSDARRHQERVERARGLYGMAASRVLENRKTDKEWGQFYAPEEEE
jgi:hypothetical protein|tara:strand:+ start:732 stop:884 length:153 start_codon:yes stop_codon:yes gene_type:complete